MPNEHPTSARRHVNKAECPHQTEITDVPAAEKSQCEACSETADLRRCLACGYVACCESHLAHNTEHFHLTGHPLIRPHRCAYDWLWCYKCNSFLE